MLLGLLTKQEAKDESKVRRDIAADPTLQKLGGIVDLIKEYQRRVASLPYSTTINDFVLMDQVVPTSVKTFLESSRFNYVVTSTPVPPPNIPGLPYTTTWVRITKVSWE